MNLKWAYFDKLKCYAKYTKIHVKWAFVLFGHRENIDSAVKFKILS